MIILFIILIISFMYLIVMFKLINLYQEHIINVNTNFLIKNFLLMFLIINFKLNN